MFPTSQRSSRVQPPACTLACRKHSPSSMTTLMSRTEPARALAKNSFSSSVATRTRNMVEDEQTEGARWAGTHSGPTLSWGSGGGAGSRVKYGPPCDWEPETAAEHKLPNLASRGGRRAACWLGWLC